jgi:nicotinamide-nucleotide amidase
VEGLKVRVTAKSPTEAHAVAVLDAEEAFLRTILGDLVFGLDEQNMESVVLDALRTRGLTLGLAEAVTGGYVSARLAAAAGADEVFRGSVVAHHADVGRSVLGALSDDTVTEEATLARARQARSVLGATVGLAVTGVVRPAPADSAGAAGAAGEARPVGTVCLAVVLPPGVALVDEVSATVRLPGDRERIRQFAAISLLDLLRRTLDGPPS